VVLPVDREYFSPDSVCKPVSLFTLPRPETRSQTIQYWLSFEYPMTPASSPTLTPAK
jgi:hypothetical protein